MSFGLDMIDAARPWLPVFAITLALLLGAAVLALATARHRRAPGPRADWFADGGFS